MRDMYSLTDKEGLQWRDLYSLPNATSLKPQPSARRDVQVIDRRHEGHLWSDKGIFVGQLNLHFKETSVVDLGRNRHRGCLR